MSWTLEATLVVPLAIGLTSACVAYSAPLYRDACRAARLEVQAAVQRTSLDSLYRAEQLTVDSIWTVGLQTSPRMILELSSLIQDDIRLLSSMFPGLGTPAQEEDIANGAIDLVGVDEKNAMPAKNGAMQP